MTLTDNCSISLHITLKNLLEKKSARDNCVFTIYQLAQAIGMPRSILVKLMHKDPKKRVTNPRIETLVRIIDFFKADGFSVSIDDLLINEKTPKKISVPEQKTNDFTIEKSITLYSLDSSLKKKIGIIDIKLVSDIKNTIALLADEDIKPIFKRGTIFIIDKDATPESDSLVAVRLDGYDKILIRKYYIQGNKKILKSFDESNPTISLMPTMRYTIIGVVIQANAKI